MEQKIRLNMIPTGPMPVCHASQYDKKREIGLVLFDGTRPLLLTDETLELDVRKSDSHIVTIDVPTPEGTNLAVFETTEQMCAVAGSNECELRIKKAGADIGSLNFIMEIERSPMENGLQSDSEIRNLARQIAEAATPVVEEIAPPIIRDFLDDDYYNKEETDEAIENATEGKADTTYVNTELDKKADKNTTYTITQVDNALNNKMDKTNPTGTGAFSLNRKANTSIGTNSFAEGENATASGYGSHSEGNGTTASGNNSHAEGVHTTASGSGSHAEGYYTIANHKGQHTFGEYNIADNSTAGASSRGNYVEVVGNGTDNDNRSNARTLDWEGNETIAGDLNFNGSTSLTAEISRLDDKIDDLPEPMIFKGTLGTGGTIQTLPAADAAHEGYTYKVITEGTYAGQAAKIGDTFTCCKPEGAPAFTWVLFSQGDTDTDTWRNIKVNGTEVIGSGTSSGPVDFIGSENIEIEYESTGNKIKAKTKNLYTKEEVDDLIEDAVYDILPSDTESGPIANFETDLALPLKSMEIEVNATQEAGTPTPSEPKAISGVSAINVVSCGLNLWNEQWELGGFAFANGTLTPATDRIRNTIPIKVKPNTQYFAVAPARFAVGYYDKDGNYLGYQDNRDNLTFTTKPNTDHIYFFCVVTSYGNNISINADTSDTTYHAYNGTTEVIELGGTYYGGRLLQDKDGHRRFEDNEYMSNTLLSDIGWIEDSGRSGVFYGTVPSNYPARARGSDIKRCSVFKATNPAPNTSDDLYISGKPSYSGASIFFRNSAWAGKTREEIQSLLVGASVVYELATPNYIDLTDGEPITTLIGTNNIYADSGDIAVEFKESINQKIASLQALLLST